MLPLGTYEGTTVIVTGGGTGLGKAIAVEFARLGAAVGILSRKEEHRLAGGRPATAIHSGRARRVDRWLWSATSAKATAMATASSGVTSATKGTSKPRISMTTSQTMLISV